MTADYVWRSVRPKAKAVRTEELEERLEQAGSVALHRVTGAGLFL